MSGSQRWFRFVETPAFTRDWRLLGLIDEDLRALQLLLIASPEVGDVVPGTGGLRKMRFGSPRLGRGKRGGVRIGYLYVENREVIVLITVYAKNDQSNLTAAEQRMIKALIGRVKEWLEQPEWRGGR